MASVLKPFIESLLDRMDQGAMITTPGGDSIEYVNDRLVQMLGRPRSRLTGTRAHELVAPADRAAVESALRATGPSEVRPQVHLVRADGASLLVSLTVARLAEGQPVCLVSDLSSQKRHAESDERTRKSLATMAHEFRNILSPIRNSVELLRRNEQLDPAARKAVDMIDRHSARLLALVEDLRSINPEE